VFRELMQAVRGLAAYMDSADDVVNS
jgi:hypothetical protein